MMSALEDQLEKLLSEETDKVRTLRAALVKVEWVYDGDVDRCPACHQRSDVGHDWACSTKDALLETK